jgi:hypothetical protein
MEHAQRSRGGHQADQAGENVDRRLDDRGRLHEAAVASPVHRVVELRVVEGRQLDPRGQVEQAFFHKVVDAGFQAPLRPARARLQSRAQGGRAGDERERGQRRAYAVGGGAAREQGPQHSGGRQEPVRGEDAREQVQRDGEDRVGPAGAPRQARRRGDEGRQPAGHPAEPGRGEDREVGLPGGQVHLGGLLGRVRQAGPLLEEPPCRTLLPRTPSPVVLGDGTSRSSGRPCVRPSAAHRHVAPAGRYVSMTMAG